MNYDVFISHAKEDKENVVEPLVNALNRVGVTCWYDKEQIGWGDGIVKCINEGLSKAQYVIAVISMDFVRKQWPLSELYSVLNGEITSGKTRVLPLFVGPDHEVELIRQELPLLNDRKFLRWAEGLV